MINIIKFAFKATKKDREIFGVIAKEMETIAKEMEILSKETPISKEKVRESFKKFEALINQFSIPIQTEILNLCDEKVQGFKKIFDEIIHR